MYIKRTTLILFLLLSISQISIAASNGFDEICAIYTETKNSNMSVKIASKYIRDNVKKRVELIDALKTHDAVMSALGSLRYTLFKDSAEHTLKNKWECPAMKGGIKKT